MSSRHQTNGPEETEAVGAALAERLNPGDVVLVEGELGSGKTTLVRGAARALGVSGPVTSPTFTIGQRYRGALTVAHVDLFRIASLDREEDDLLDDYIGPDTITFVEWPSVGEAEIAALGRIAVRASIEYAGGDRRLIQLQTGFPQPSHR